MEINVKEKIRSIIDGEGDSADKAISLCLYCMKAQLLNDGNKRAAVIFAKHYLISMGGEVLVNPENAVPEFKRLLIIYYENLDNGEIREFMKKECLRKQ